MLAAPRRQSTEPASDLAPMPYERRPEDTEPGWWHFMQFMRAPAEITFSEWAADQPPEIALEGSANHWEHRRLLALRHIAEREGLISQARTARTASLANEKMQWILEKIDQGLERVGEDGETKFDVDTALARRESFARAMKNLQATGSNKLVVAVQNNNTQAPPNTQPPPFGSEWGNQP